jgi:hypothetical protein
MTLLSALKLAVATVSSRLIAGDSSLSRLQPISSSMWNWTRIARRHGPPMPTEQNSLDQARVRSHRPVEDHHLGRFLPLAFGPLPVDGYLCAASPEGIFVKELGASIAVADRRTGPMNARAAGRGLDPGSGFGFPPTARDADLGLIREPLVDLLADRLMTPSTPPAPPA